MGIAPRQIGWSNESNLLWNISKQLEKLNGVVAATAAGGMLNPTTNYIPFNSGLAFGDSYLVNDTTASVLKTVYSGNDIGLKLDFGNSQYFFGDYTTNPTGNFLLVDMGGSIICSSSVFYGSEGIVLDMANRIYLLGDPGNLNNTYLTIDDTNQRWEMSSNLSANTAGASSGQFLKVRIGGVDYKIALLNNA
jgi:hypothetical protein